MKTNSEYVWEVDQLEKYMKEYKEGQRMKEMPKYYSHIIRYESMKCLLASRVGMAIGFGQVNFNCLWDIQVEMSQSVGYLSETKY